MKKIEIAAYGAPEAVAHCIEAPDVGMPGAGEIVFDVLAFPINPADLSMIRGNYRLQPPLPATPGAECVGRVAAVGVGVALRPGDLVINRQRENWVQRRRIAEADAIAIPPGLDLAQAAMLRINPATAQLLLEDHVALAPGDWVIQNVANSAVGRHLIVLARTRGIRTVNVVRRDDVGAELRALGADAVLADGPDLAERARAAAGGAPIRLGIDAVSGGATKRIADCVAEVGRGPGDEPRRDECPLSQPDQLQSRPRPGEAHAGRGEATLRRTRRKAARRRAEGADRCALSDRGDQGSARPRATGRSQRQGRGPAERPSLR
jgi:NADPH:quinone reductase-like Zn-dependent oxidoreductase